MSTLVFLRKFTVRFLVGALVLAAPNAVLATNGDDGEEGDHHGPGKSHINIQITDEALDSLTSMLSTVNFTSSCSGGPGTDVGAAVQTALGG